MNLDEFYKNSNEVIDWIYNYYKDIESLPVLSIAKPNDVFNSFSEEPPLEPIPFSETFIEFKDKILPGITHWQHPQFFAYFPANASFPSILGEFLTSALASQCMVWQTSPAAAELEEKVMNWLKKMIGLPNYFEGVIQDTASTATLCSILTARESKSNYKINNNGFENNKFVCYCSKEAHSSIEKAVKIAGIGKENLRKIDCNSDFSINCEKLEAQINKDINEGLTPLIIIGALGTTSSLAFDSIYDLGVIAKKYDIWLHVDAAYAGSALILDEFKYLINGIEFVDTFVFNPHKWLLTNFDCSAYFVNDKGKLIQTFEIMPEYLKTQNDNVVKNYRDWGIQLGRRFRALKLWFVIQSYGVSGLKNKLRNDIKLTNYFLEEFTKINGIEILAPVKMNVICWRYNPNNLNEDELNTINEKLHFYINENSNVFITHTKLNGKYTLRIVFGQLLTEIKHINYLLEEIKKAVQII